MTQPPHAEHVAEFWDRNPHLSTDPEFWMAHPICRRAINARVSGREETWPLDFLYERAGSPHFRRMLSLGCGTGRLERAVRRLDIADTIEAIDASAVSIEIARATAREEGFPEIEYSVADLNRLRLSVARYDAIVFHQSLHHVRAVERLVDQVRRALTPRGLLFLEEWTGPSRFDWSPALLARARALFSGVPREWRKWDDLRTPIEENDPTEAVRSSAIRPTVRRLFATLVDRPYGGQIVSVLLPQLERAVIPSLALDDLIARWLALEAEELAESPESSYYNAMLARPRGGAGAVAGRVANVAIRTRQAAGDMFRLTR